MRKKEKKYVATGYLSQDEIDQFIDVLARSKMNDEDIEKIGKYKRWFAVNDKYKEQNKKNERKGK